MQNNLNFFLSNASLSYAVELQMLYFQKVNIFKQYLDPRNKFIWIFSEDGLGH